MVWPTALVPETFPDALNSEWSGAFPPSRDMLSEDDAAYPLQWRATLTGSEFHVVWAGVLHKARFDTGCTEMSEPHVLFPRGMPEQATQTVMDLLRRISAAKTPEELYTFHAAGERCGICRRKLRDALSRASGIGPDCADKLGWDQHKIAELRQRVWR
jgi:bacterioferritin-associated ferredoxin